MTEQDQFEWGGAEGVEREFESVDKQVRQVTSVALTLESLSEALQAPVVSPAETQLLNHTLEQLLEFFQVETLPFPKTQVRLSLEQVAEFSNKTVQSIVEGMNDVSEWLLKVLNHIDENAQDQKDRAAGLQQKLKDVESTCKAPEGEFVYRSIMRNLVSGQRVNGAQLGKELDVFLKKTQLVLASVRGGLFGGLLHELESFELTADRKLNDERITHVFSLVQKYLHSILSHETHDEIYGLEPSATRQVLYDPHIYLGGKLFYSYAPTELRGATNTVSSGILRTTAGKIDLKAPIKYLTKRQCDDVLETLADHLEHASQEVWLRDVSKKLLGIMSKTVDKYRRDKLKRKEKIDTRGYIAVLNIASGLLYGLHIKALNQRDSVVNAALNYVDKSIKAHDSAR